MPVFRGYTTLLVFEAIQLSCGALHFILSVILPQIPLGSVFSLNTVMLSYYNFLNTKSFST